MGDKQQRIDEALALRDIARISPITNARSPISALLTRTTMCGRVVGHSAPSDALQTGWAGEIARCWMEPSRCRGR